MTVQTTRDRNLDPNETTPAGAPTQAAADAIGDWAEFGLAVVRGIGSLIKSVLD